MTAEAYRLYGDVEQATLSEGVLKHLGFSEPKNRQCHASKPASDPHGDALVRVLFRR